MFGKNHLLYKSDQVSHPPASEWDQCWLPLPARGRTTRRFRAGRRSCRTGPSLLSLRVNYFAAMDWKLKTKIELKFGMAKENLHLCWIITNKFASINLFLRKVKTRCLLAIENNIRSYNIIFSLASVKSFDAYSLSSLSIKHITPKVRCNLLGLINKDSSKPLPGQSWRTLFWKDELENINTTLCSLHNALSQR